MDLQMDGGMTCAGLATLLAKVVSDPANSESLYQILGTYCHQCRNVLHTMKLSLFLAQRSSPPAEVDTWKKLETEYLAVEHFFDRLQLVCRPMAVNPVRMPFSLLVEDRLGDWTTWLARRGQSLDVTAPDEPAIGDYDPARMAQGLDAFVAWRGEAGRAGESARLRWGVDAGHFQLEWTEPNPRDGSLSRRPHDQPERLALPLLARVVTAHAGTLDFDVQDVLQLRLRWPLHVRRPM